MSTPRGGCLDPLGGESGMVRLIEFQSLFRFPSVWTVIWVHMMLWADAKEEAMFKMERWYTVLYLAGAEGKRNQEGASL